MKKFNQVLGEDEKLRVQLEMLISPTCSCKQAEICVVRGIHSSAVAVTNHSREHLIPEDHVVHCNVFEKDGPKMVCFKVTPLQGDVML